MCRIRRQKIFGHLVVKITFRVVAEARWPAKIMDHSRRVEVRAQVSPIEAQAYIHIPAGPFLGDITIVGITIATELRVPLGDKRLVRIHQSGNTVLYAVIGLCYIIKLATADEISRLVTNGRMRIGIGTLSKIAFIFRPLDDLNALDLYDMNSLLDIHLLFCFFSSVERDEA